MNETTRPLALAVTKALNNGIHTGKVYAHFAQGGKIFFLPVGPVAWAFHYDAKTRNVTSAHRTGPDHAPCVDFGCD